MRSVSSRCRLPAATIERMLDCIRLVVRLASRTSVSEFVLAAKQFRSLCFKPSMPGQRASAGKRPAMSGVEAAPSNRNCSVYRLDGSSAIRRTKSQCVFSAVGDICPNRAVSRYSIVDMRTSSLHGADRRAINSTDPGPTSQKVRFRRKIKHRKLQAGGSNSTGRLYPTDAEESADVDCRNG